MTPDGRSRRRRGTHQAGFERSPPRTPADALLVSSQRYTELADALTALSLNRDDRRRVEEHVTQAGLLDATLGEWIAVEQRSLADAHRCPLRHSGEHRSPEQAHWSTVTLALPSTRIVQVQRYYVDAAELHAAFAQRVTPPALPDAALTIREIVVTPTPSEAATIAELLALIERATVCTVCASTPEP